MELIELEQLIISQIESVTGKEKIPKDTHLFGAECDLTAREMIYVIDSIEKKLGKSIAFIFEIADFRVLTVERLANAMSNTYR